jgi:DNA modification methylase
MSLLMAENTLYFGDNLQILRDSIRDESVDLIYLDPPFNSKRDYNLLFKSPKGHESDAQITAFEDSWHWGEQAEREFGELIHQPNTDVAEMMNALRNFLGENDMMAYLTMMANRLLELHRVLKPTGSLYLHCDPTASHYLKIVLDGVFGKENFTNEIIWRRTRAHNDKSLKKYGAIHDVLLYYTKTDSAQFNISRTERNENAPKTHDLYQHTDGKLYRKGDCRAPGDRGPRWTWNGITMNWRFTEQEGKRLEAEGKIVFSKTGMPRVLRPVDLTKGSPLQDVWTDVDAINSGAGEFLPYPTQKPQALLERIIETSSNEGDVVLDPFCGCGTAVHAAQKLNRKWIGIDITHLAISLIEKRLKDAFGAKCKFEVHGTPKDEDGARDLMKRKPDGAYQFQWWACSLVNAQPYQGKKKGADSGIDGLIYFQDDKTLPKKIVVSVKGGENVSVAMIRDFGHVIDRENAAIGLFVTLAEPTRPMKEEAVATGYYESPAGASFPKIQILTIKGLLEGTEQAVYPDLMRGGLMFKKAKQEIQEEQDQLFQK